jgi:hypothetical protein
VQIGSQNVGEIDHRTTIQIFSRIPDSFLPLPTRTITNQPSGEEDKKKKISFNENYFNNFKIKDF